MLLKRGIEISIAKTLMQKWAMAMGEVAYGKISVF